MDRQAPSPRHHQTQSRGDSRPRLSSPSASSTITNPSIAAPNQWKTLVNRQNLLEHINAQQNTPNINFPIVAQFPFRIDILRIGATAQSGLPRPLFSCSKVSPSNTPARQFQNLTSAIQLLTSGPP